MAKSKISQVDMSEVLQNPDFNPATQRPVRKTGSSTKGHHRMRCRDYTCYKRVTLKRHPSEYKREPRCKFCGGELRSVEMERLRELAKKDTCYCNAYPFPHQKGTLRMCDHHPQINEQVTEEEYQDYLSCLSTPRTEWQ